MECSWNDGGKTQYYIVILDQLQGYSGGLVWALESRVRGPLTAHSLGYPTDIDRQSDREERSCKGML